MRKHVSGETAFRDARIETYAFLETQSDPLEWALLYRDELDAQLEETQEQIMWSDDVDTTRSLLSEYKELQKQKGRFANTLGGDYLCLNAAIRSMQHINGLEQSWEAEIQTMKHAAKRLNYTALAKESLYLEHSYQGLRIPEFGNYEPADSWITWNGSYGCLILSVLCELCLSQEKKRCRHAAGDRFIRVLSRRKVLARNSGTSRCVCSNDATWTCR